MLINSDAIWYNQDESGNVAGSLKILEAMARGCPVIAANAASIPEVVDGAGLLVEPRSPDAIAAAVRQLLTDPDLQTELRTAGPRRAEAFGWKAAGQALIGAYRDALALEGRP